MPHGWNLKDQTEEEQLIGEKYLRRWGILRGDIQHTASRSPCGRFLVVGGRDAGRGRLCCGP